MVLKLLLQGKTVVATKRNSSNLKEIETVFSYYVPNAKELFNKIIWRDIDLNDVLSLDELLKDVTNVYHCARRKRQMSSPQKATMW